MISVAYVFPGQGSQAVGMGRELAEVSSVAAAVFAAADDALGEPISRLAWDGPEDDLNRTENAQPALVATSIAYLAALRERQGADGNAQSGPAARPRFMAGHSMGQYSALVAAGVVSIEDGVRLVRERGVRMQQSGAGRDGAMAAVIGLDEAAIPKLVRLASAHGVFGVANRNSPGQVVVSGERPAIDAAVEIAKSLGARLVKVLPVSVAAHSPLMAEAATAMRKRPQKRCVRGPDRAIDRQRGWAPARDRRGLSRRARRAPHDRRRLGPGRRDAGNGGGAASSAPDGLCAKHVSHGPSERAGP